MTLNLFKLEPLIFQYNVRNSLPQLSVFENEIRQSHSMIFDLLAMSDRVS